MWGGEEQDTTNAQRSPIPKRYFNRVIIKKPNGLIRRVGKVGEDGISAWPFPEINPFGFSLVDGHVGWRGTRHYECTKKSYPEKIFQPSDHQETIRKGQRRSCETDERGIETFEAFACTLNNDSPS